MSGLATRLYRGEAGIDVVRKRRNLWFLIAGALVVVALSSFLIRGFSLGIEFSGGNQYQLPASAGSLTEVEDAAKTAGAEVVSAQTVGRGDSATYLLRTGEVTQEENTTIKQGLAQRLGIAADQISDSRVSPAWGGQVTRQALLGLLIFLVLVSIYLILRFEWRMAAAAVSSLLLDLVVTAGVYSLVGFEVTPSTVIGFLTILGFALYDVVVVFDKVQENTRGITSGAAQTYPEAANLAVNQTLMRSINTGLVALLPVGGLLFIGAGLLGAGTLEDLGLVLFVGMGAAVYSSIFFATPVLTLLKSREPKYVAHTQRVLARRAQLAKGGAADAKAARAARSEPEPVDATLAGTAAGAAAPKAGARPAPRRAGAPGNRGGNRGGGGRGGRPSGSKRR
ncbi:protein translocase subunit SecF [Rhizomonospora bruguierae]|uniref:protein translocase subunit SecF n=1 Tax=Rhizomonospora bruguierae TaxID=1581705 RepID=UPI001BCD4FD8|nr:protein translocase subunit SecF [Micromonospora sp. NBRC 107566]